MDWYEVAIIAVAILGVILSGTMAFKWRQGVRLLSELSEAFTKSGVFTKKASVALKDKKLTKAEAVELAQETFGCLKEWQDVFLMVMLFVGKK